MPFLYNIWGPKLGLHELRFKLKYTALLSSSREVHSRPMVQSYQINLSVNNMKSTVSINIFPKLIVGNDILILHFLICHTQLRSHQLSPICPYNWIITSHRLERHIKSWSDCYFFTSKNENKSTLTKQVNLVLSIWDKAGFSRTVPSGGKF